METISFTNEMLLVLSILAFTVYLFAFEIVRVDVAAILVMILIGIAGLVPPTELFSGFSSNAVISIIAVMVIGAGLDKTGIMSQLAGQILRIGGSSEKRIIPIISGTVGVISSFMQNIGAAALFLPVVSRISTRTGIPLSRLLMPMGFCAILGGTMTMIGSSPLILLNDLIETSNRSLPAGVVPMATFDLFDVTPVGFVLLAVGIGYFVIAGRFILPKSRGMSAVPAATTQYFASQYGIEGGVFEAKVSLESPLAGRTVGEIEDDDDHAIIIGIRNADELHIAPARDEMVWVGSICALMGSSKHVREFAHRNLLERSRHLDAFLDVLNPSRAGVSEVVIPPGSSVIGRPIGELEIRRRYGVNILGLYHDEQVVSDQIRSRRLFAGDTLVLHSRWEDLSRLASNRDFVVVTDFPREILRPKKVPHALTFFAIALGLVLFTDVRLSLALFTGAIGMVATGVLSMDEAYKSISWQSVFLLASLIPLGMAVETSGTAAWIAQQTLLFVGDIAHWQLQAVIAVLATFFTLVISNVGATVLLVPLAVNIAIGAGANPAAFALTVALATSNSFLLPTHQVNALIMGAGGYRAVDFIRAGAIMTVLFLVVMLVMVNVIVIV